MVHLPIPAPWRNQVELSRSIIQRPAPTPDAFPDRAAVEARLLAFETLDRDTARPFGWRCTRATPEERLAQLTPVATTAPVATGGSFQQAASPDKRLRK